MTNTTTFPAIPSTDLDTVTGGSDSADDGTFKPDNALSRLASSAKGRRLLAEYLPPAGTKGHP